MRDPSRDLKLDIIDCIVDVLLPKCFTAPVEITEHFIKVLKSKAISRTENAIDSQSAKACLAGIFRLCKPSLNADSHEINIASVALPVFIYCVSKLLTRFLRDDVSGQQMQEFRFDEARSALDYICNLSIPTNLELNIGEFEIQTTHGISTINYDSTLQMGRTHTRPHLIALFPLFCDLVLLRDMNLRRQVQLCLRSYSIEMGIIILDGEESGI